MQVSSKRISLMADFWLATYDWSPAKGVPTTPGQPKNVIGLALEVMREGGQYGILFSWIVRGAPGSRTTLVCQIGFANEAKVCGVWTDRGFPLLDAAILEGGENLIVTCPCFDDGPALDYGATPITISGLGNLSKLKPTESLNASYSQNLRTPDPVFCSSLIVQDDVTWSPTRSNVLNLTGALEVTINKTRYPVLEAFRTGVTRPKDLWSGKIDLPPTPAEPRSRADLSTANRDATFGFPGFIFDDVEILGFRIDLSRHGDASGLSELIKPLNFHLDGKGTAGNAGVASALSDFRYEPATRTLNLELLRYGKMKLVNANKPLRPDDFQSQHELVLKVLVGRVDDDTAQARDPAIFVPAIFVDNTWSRAIGRVVQGFDKRMAGFWTTTSDGCKQQLRPDGRLAPDTNPAPLGSVSEIRLQTRTPGAPNDGERLLTLDCPQKAIEDSSFLTVDLRLIYSPLSYSIGRWRQSDFEEEEFRRSFARAAIAGPLEGFQSIQVTPVGGTDVQTRLANETTWITGTFEIDPGVEIAWPDGVASLTFHAAEAAPAAWRDFCKLLGIKAGEPGIISLPPGDWYRVRLSTRLTIGDGLP
jgi:hypothetical protein